MHRSYVGFLGERGGFANLNDRQQGGDDQRTGTVCIDNTCVKPRSLFCFSFLLILSPPAPSLVGRGGTVVIWATDQWAK